MNKQELTKLKELLDQIDYHDDLYYNQDTSEISDPEYDGLKDNLKSLAKKFTPKPGSKADEKLRIRLEDAITRVGAPPPKNGKWPKIVHEVSMQSLNKVNTPDELVDWNRKCGSAKQFLCTEKLDGISVSLKYDDGVLISAGTRGTNGVGENITRNVKKMKGVLCDLPEDFTGHIRGEIVLLHSDWKKYLSDKANPRNAASGVAKRIDGYQSQHLTVMVYTIDGKDFDREDQAFKYLESLGFNVPNYSVCTLEEVTKTWHKYMNKTRAALDYDIDGLVIRLNDRKEQFALGEEAHRPKGATAFKFEAPEARTKTTNIVCQVGDTGKITPVVEFEPVELMGATITRATLHNFSNVKNLKARIGCTVLVSRANDVIPFIKEVIDPTDEYFKAPTKCPACGAKTIQVGEYVACPNKKSCPAQVIGRLNKWIGELGILEWGEAILTKLIDAGTVEDVYDLYTLEANDITSLERMGEKGAKNLLDELDKYRKVSLENFLGGLCIEGIATSSVKSVMEAGYDTLDQIRKLSIEDFESIPGFGEKKATSFHDGLIENASRIDKILNAGVSIKGKEQKIIGKLTSLSFCFTGTMVNKRSKLEQMVKDAGGDVKDKVDKSLSYLVIADPNSTSSKANKARNNGTKLLSEDEFLKMIQ